MKQSIAATRMYVVGRAADFMRVRDTLDVLVTLGCDVALFTVERERMHAHPGHERYRPFVPAPATPGSGLRTRVIRRLARLAASIVPTRIRLLISLRYCPLPAGAKGTTAHYVPLSDVVGWPEGWAKARRKTMVVLSPQAGMAHVTAHARCALDQHYAGLLGKVRAGQTSRSALAARSDWQYLMTDHRVRQLGVDMGDYPSDAIWFAMHGFLDVARSILDLASVHYPNTPTSADHDAAHEIVRISETGEATEATLQVAARLSAAADDAYESGHLTRASTLFTHLLTLVFHHRLHASSASSPIVDSPDTWLAPVRRSKIREQILSRARRAGDTRSQSARQPRVTMLCGSYPRFSRPVVEAVQSAGFDTTAVIPGDEDRLMAGVGPNAAVVRILLGLDPVPLWDWWAEAERSTHLFIDWADRAAAVAVSWSTAGRIVLRLHSVDLLSCWVHLVPLDKVDEIVVVSEPMADLVRRAVDVPGDTPLTVLPNLINVDRFDLPKNPNASRTVAVVGWAQQVKDPMWALEVLAALRRSDPEWQFLFVGTDFTSRGSRAAREYAARFRQRMLDDDVRGGVRFVGYTHDLPRVFQDVRFVLSSSLREGGPVALMEGMASRAVPVVRDWPTFRPLDAAGRVTDPRWVVTEPADAAEVIRGWCAQSDGGPEGAEAREWLVRHIATPDIGQRYVRTVVGMTEGEA